MTEGIMDALFDDRYALMHFFAKHDSPELRARVLATDRLRFWYCRYVRDLKSVWENISEEEWLYNYCRYVKERKCMWRRITSELWLHSYVQHISPRKDIVRRLDAYWVLYKAA